MTDEIEKEEVAEKQPDKTVELETKLKEAQSELEKLRNKEYNFKKLRDMTEDEKEKLSEKEKEIITRTEVLEEEQRTFKESVIESHKKDALAVLAGDDEELRKKIEYNYARIKDEAITKDDINKKMKDAYALATNGLGNSINQINRAATYQGESYRTTKSNKLTSEQADLAGKLGLSEDDLKKHYK